MNSTKEGFETKYMHTEENPKTKTQPFPSKPLNFYNKHSTIL